MNSRRAFDTTVVVPCHDEAARLDVGAFRAFLREHDEISLLFVDAASHDLTTARIHDAIDGFPGHAEILDLPADVGKGEAVRIGMLRGLENESAFVGYWDADLATPLSAVPEFRELLRTRLDLEWVLGARVKLLGRTIERRATRHYLGRFFAAAASLTLGLGVYDTQCGAKLFRASPDLEALLGEPFLSRWIFEVEMIARLSELRRQGGGPGPELALYEYPLREWRDVGGSKLRLGDFLWAPVELGQIWLRYAPSRGAATPVLVPPDASQRSRASAELAQSSESTHAA